jgi:hypothetical protein
MDGNLKTAELYAINAALEILKTLRGCYAPSVQLLTLPMLKGAELLAKVKELGNAPKSELVRACGYVIKDRVAFTQFYEALLEAKGVDLGSKTAKRGRGLTYKAKVQFNGKLQIGDGYLREMGYEPGAEFDIKIGRNSITLTAA